MSENMETPGVMGKVDDVPFVHLLAPAYRESTITELAPSVFFAMQKILGDESCPNGIFDTSVAVDRSPTKALSRAKFEAAERYATAAILAGHRLVPHRSIDEAEALRFPVTLCSPLDRLGISGDSLFISFCDRIGESFDFAAVADVFAPYPIKRRECSWHPTTNGVAVGSTVEAAKFSAFLEYFERHSIMDLWYRDGKSNLMAREMIQQKCEHELRYMESLGYNIQCFEISSLRSISVVLSFCQHREKIYPYMVCAAGAAYSMEAALLKSVQELIQTTVACAGQVAQFHQWRESGRLCENLSHRMYLYADPSRAEETSNILCELINRSTHMNISPNESLSWAQELVEVGLSASFVDITPDVWGRSLFCIRCLSSSMLPLFVSESMLPNEMRENPMRRFSLPHPFA